MKTASKIFLIISGIIGIFVILASAYITFAFAIGTVAVGISSIINFVSFFNSNSSTDLTNALSLVLGTVVVLVFGLISLSETIFAVFGVVFSFSGARRTSKKSIHICGIVFTGIAALSSLPFCIFGFIYLIMFVFLIFFILLLIFTPMFWGGILIIVGTLGCLLFGLLALLGHIFGLVAISKEKKLEKDALNDNFVIDDIK